MENILVFANVKSVYGGNFIPSLLALESRLNDINYNVIYILPVEAENREWFYYLCNNGHKVETMDFQLSKRDQLKEIRKLITKYNPQIIHAHFCSEGLFCLLAQIHRKIKFILHIHSDFTKGLISKKEKILNFIKYRILSSKVKFLCVCKNFTLNNPKKMVYVPNGLSTNRIPCDHSNREITRRLYDVKDDEILCELFGWSPEVKGVDIAVQAVDYVNKNTDYRVKLMIVCGQEYDKDNMKKFIKNHTSCSGEEEFIIYAEPKEDVFAYHEGSDILLGTSRSEGFPYSVMEMLSLGKPCIISDIQGHQWANNYDCIKSFKSCDYTDCAESLIYYIKNGNMYSNIVRDKIKDDYSIDKWCDKIIEEYVK